MSASLYTLRRRAKYGGRKGRSAARRLLPWRAFLDITASVLLPQPTYLHMMFAERMATGLYP